MWDFVKNAVVASIDEVPEKYRGLYAENAEKKFALTDAAKGIVADFIGLHGTLAETKSKLTAANKESAERRVTQSGLADFLRAQGVENISAENPMESLTTFVTELTDANKRGKEVKVNLETIRKEAETRIANVTTAKDGEIAKMLGALKKYMIGEATAAELAKQKGNVAVLTPHITAQARVVPDGDEYVVRVVDAAGNMRTGSTGQPMSIAELVGEFKSNKDFASNFESETKSGNGSQPGKSSTTTRPVQQQGGEKTPHEKIAAGLAKMKAGRG